MNIIKILLVFLITMTQLSCNNSNKAGNNPDEISVQNLKSAHEDGKDFYLLDVRTAPEFYQGRLSFANDLIPYDSLQHYVDKLPQDKTTTIYLFCRSGRRSGIATAYLRSLGYPQAYNVSGGIIAWQDAGYEIKSGN